MDVFECLAELRLDLRTQPARPIQSVLVLLAIVLIGIVFDLVGTAAAAAQPDPLQPWHPSECGVPRKL